MSAMACCAQRYSPANSHFPATASALTPACLPARLQLGIKVAPTFLLYKGGEIVDKMTGAKTEQLRELIEKHI